MKYVLSLGKIEMPRESSPMRVWPSIGLIVMASMAYAVSVWFMEYLMAAFR
jgi:hypothetical protein